MFSLSTVVVSDKCSPLPIIGWADRFWAIEDWLPEPKDVRWDWMRLRALGVPLFPS